MSVRAKFFVQETRQQAGGGGGVTLQVVCRGEDNKTWSKYTPSGQINMTVLNEAALAQFKPGQEFFVDFSPVPDERAGKEGME